MVVFVRKRSFASVTRAQMGKPQSFGISCRKAKMERKRTTPDSRFRHRPVPRACVGLFANHRCGASIAAIRRRCHGGLTFNSGLLIGRKLQKLVKNLPAEQQERAKMSIASRKLPTVSLRQHMFASGLPHDKRLRSLPLIRWRTCLGERMAFERT